MSLYICYRVSRGCKTGNILALFHEAYSLEDGETEAGRESARSGAWGGRWGLGGGEALSHLHLGGVQNRDERGHPSSELGSEGMGDSATASPEAWTGFSRSRAPGLLQPGPLPSLFPPPLLRAQ